MYQISVITIVAIPTCIMILDLNSQVSNLVGGVAVLLLIYLLCH